MKVVVREAAAADLDGILDWISKDNPRAAAELVRRILARIDRLAIPGLSHVGRGASRRHARTRGSAVYHCLYRGRPGEITALAIVHGARNRKA
jgi:plasmid stabilization system protein ParE